MRTFFIIVILFNFQNCRESNSSKNYKLTDDYSTVKKLMNKISVSDMPLSQRQTETFNLLKIFNETYPLSQNNLVLLASANNLSGGQYDTLFNRLNIKLRQDPYWTSIGLTKAQIKIAETGKLFPDIILVDTLNKSINTNSLRGKTLFIDFWSSWCVSCREQFPQLKQTYAKYNSKGLEIFGVSMDSKKKSWVSALQKDSLPWRQFCELVNFQENSFAKRFKIMGIPANFLIDKNGLLIGQDISPNELDGLISKL